jgi:fluoride exporter
VRYAAVFVGGALGALARWGVAAALAVSPDRFPLATFLVNVTGAFGLGIAAVLLTERLPPGRYLRPLVAIGFFGAYTTFSIMAVEGVRLVEAGRIPLALTYWISTLLAGQAAGIYGMWLARLRPLPERRRS